MSAPDLQSLLNAHKHGQHEQTIRIAQTLLTTAPTPQVHFILGRALLELDRNEQAAAAFQSCLLADTGHAHASTYLGIALLRLGRHKEATAHLEKSVTQDPADLDAWFFLGLSQQSAGDLDAAERAIGRVATARPHLAAVWKVLGSIREAQRKRLEAAEAYQRAFELEPTAPHAASFIGAIAKADIDKLNAPLAAQAFRLVYKNVFNQHPNLNVLLSSVIPFSAWRDLYPQRSIEIDPKQTVALSIGSPPRPDTYLAEATWVTAIEGATVIMGWDYVIAPTGHVIDSSGYMPARQVFAWMPHVYSRPARKAMYVWPSEETTIDEPALFMSTPQDYQIGHWFVDFLPRLRALAFIGTGRLKIAIPRTLPPRHREALRAFGVADSDLLELEIARRYRFASLHVMHQGHRNDPQPAKVRYMHSIMSRPGEIPSSQPKRLYFARTQSGRGRMVQNQAEMDLVLKRFQIETVHLAKLPFDQQLAHVRNATIVIAAMGSDLASMFALPATADVIMLVQEDTVETGVEADVQVHERYGAILGMRIHRLVCKPVPQSQVVRSNNPRANYYRDFVVAPDALTELLERIVHSRTEPGV